MLVVADIDKTVETYKSFIGTMAISFGSNDFEIYFEEDDFDKFVYKLEECDVEYVHPVKEHSWGQRNRWQSAWMCQWNL